jgi:hypothetical protein
MSDKNRRTGFWTRTYQLVYRCNIENNNCFLDESPAFVCEKVSVELEIDRMTDMAVNEMMKTKNVLYISRGQLKNHTSTVINFTIGTAFQIFIDRIAIQIGCRSAVHFPACQHAPAAPPPPDQQHVPERERHPKRAQRTTSRGDQTSENKRERSHGHQASLVE